MTVLENAIGKIVLRATKEEITENSDGGKMLLTYMHNGETTIREFPVPRIIDNSLDYEAYYIYDPVTKAWRT